MSKLDLVRNLQKQGKYRAPENNLGQLDYSIIFVRDHVQILVCAEKRLDTRAGLPAVLCCCLACNHLVSTRLFLLPFI